MNSDIAELIHARTSSQEWVKTSKTGTVERRRVFRLGGQESGRVTSVVRYLPGAAFPSHPHPQGEEIFVLDGIFSDWRGDHGKGTFLLNPEGFEHAPHSKNGCLLFVRLRQFPGINRPQKAMNTNDIEWDVNNGRKILMEKTFDDTQYLQRIENGKQVTIQVTSNGMEIFIIEGNVMLMIENMIDNRNEEIKTQQYDWIRIPSSKKENVITLTVDDGHGNNDAVVLVKENALRSAFAPIE